MTKQRNRKWATPVAWALWLPIRVAHWLRLDWVLRGLLRLVVSLEGGNEAEASDGGI